MQSQPRLTLLWQAGRLLAIDKPAGLAAIPGRAQTDSALEALGRQLALPTAGKEDPRVRLVHRIDRYTSGVLLFATDKSAQRHLSAQFHDRTIDKQYLALVAGTPPSNEGQIDSPLAIHPTDKRRMCVSKQGAPALTLWKIEQRLGPFTLLRCFPKTGKTHQIRVHLASIGLPLAIDLIYNHRHKPKDAGIFLSHFKRNYKSNGVERPLIDRLTLHAERVSFVDMAQLPATVVAPLPKDFRAAINMLGKWAR